MTDDKSSRLQYLHATDSFLYIPVTIGGMHLHNVYWQAAYQYSIIYHY